MRARRALTALAGLALTAALALGCATAGPVGRVNIIDRGAPTRVKSHYLGLPLRSGQIVLTESPDATSYAFLMLPDKFYPFTHAAVLSMEDDEPWVYDVTGGVASVPLHSRMLDNISGKMYRRPLFEYASPNIHTEIYDPPPGTDGEKMAAYVRKLYAGGDVKFDTHFDAHDHTSLFCTELVALSVEAAGGKPPPVGPASDLRSIDEIMTFLGVPRGEAYPVGLFAEPSRYVAAIGPLPSRAAAWSYFEAKREVYRRFTADQRIGHVLAVSGNGELSVRPEILAFAAEASRLWNREATPPLPGDPRIARAVRELADQRFGPFPDRIDRGGRGAQDGAAKAAGHAGRP